MKPDFGFFKERISIMGLFYLKNTKYKILGIAHKNIYFQKIVGIKKINVLFKIDSFRNLKRKDIWGL